MKLILRSYLTITRITECCWSISRETLELEGREGRGLEPTNFKNSKFVNEISRSWNGASLENGFSFLPRTVSNFSANGNNEGGDCQFRYTRVEKCNWVSTPRNSTCIILASNREIHHEFVIPAKLLETGDGGHLDL